MQKKQITLSDLAKELGISTATVSRALKDYPDISTATKKKVLALAKKLNYRPNTMAAGLRKRESKVIGVIIPSIVNHFFSSVIKGIMEVAYEEDYRVMLCQSDESYEKEVADAAALFASRVDGILVSLAHETKDYDHLQAFQDSGIPLVFFDKVPETMKDISKVVVDDYRGAYRAVEHLIQLGHKKIAHFRGPMIASTSKDRYKGYQDALLHHGLNMEEELIYDCVDITIEEGEGFARELHRKHPDCTAIFCITDSVALGSMVALREAGVNIPRDMAVCGFSDWKISSIFEPALTSVAQPSLEMGKQATQLLLSEIKASKEDESLPSQHIVLHTELIIRSSTHSAQAVAS